MIRPNYTEKALVVYTPSVESATCDKTINSTWLSKIYICRARKYHCLLALFFIVFVFSRCLFMYTEEFGNEVLAEVDVAFLQNGFSIKFIYQHFWPCFLDSFLAFLAGFTVFAYPAALLAVLHLFFNAAFLYSTVIDNVYQTSFLTSFSFIALFSVFIFFTVAFFAEVLHFNCIFRSDAMTKHTVAYVLFYILYISVTFGILFLILYVI